jgi:hypothetical protein
MNEIKDTSVDTAYNLLGLKMPERVVKTRSTKSGTRFTLGFREMLLEDAKVIDIMPRLVSSETDFSDETLCRAYRCMIAYKITHKLQEIPDANGGATLLFVKRGSLKTPLTKSFEILSLEDKSIYKGMRLFLSECLSAVTDGHGFFTDSETGIDYMLAVHAGNKHLIQVSMPIPEAE